MIEKQNALEWLEFIITIALDSSESEVSTLTQAQYENITKNAYEKKQKYISFINHQIPSLSSRRKIQHLIKQHHGSLLLLLDNATRRAKRTSPLNTLTVNAFDVVSTCIYELLTFIEISFGEYLDLDDRAPHSYISYIAKGLQNRIDIARQQLRQRSADPKLIAILTDTLGNSAYETQAESVSFRAIFYQRELLSRLEQIPTLEKQVKMDDALVELLVYLNFNSRSFMNYYTKHLATGINSAESVTEKIKQLLLRYKEFNQMHRKPGVKLLSSESDVKKVISNWFIQEITFLKEKSQWDVVPLPPASSIPTKQEPLKVMILLSVDQIGLFLRALDSLRILKAKSLNAVFQSITPFLSTPRKTEISWDSMRSKSYSFEEKDKQVVIKVLESVIAWIKEY